MTSEVIFQGTAPAAGSVAQVSTNDKIKLIIIDEKGVSHEAFQSIGQFIVIPPHQYQDIQSNLEELRKLKQGK